MIRTFSLPYHYKLNYQKNSNILAKEYNTIYFNTQKNANSTLKAQFVEILNLPKTAQFPADIHYQYNFPAALQHELNTKYGDFLKFSILRNPWDRLASCYNNKIRIGSRTGKDYILDCSPHLYIGMPFKEFVDVISDIPDSEADYHFCSQIYLMLYPDGMFPMNYLCNIEMLDFHINEIREKTGIPFKPLARLNSSTTFNYESMYTPDLIDNVAERYPADIEFFKYEFGVKNSEFAFGEVSGEWIRSMMEHHLMIKIMREKNRELIQELSPHVERRIMDIEKLKRESINMRKEADKMKEKLNLIENSLSWRITQPLRNILSKFGSNE